MMPLNPEFQNHMYSVNIGPVHFLIFNIDLYHNKVILNVTEMVEWVKNDLEIADSDENRNAYPWIIAMGHIPLYCGDPNDSGCAKTEGTSERELGYYQTWYAEIEPLFYKHNVDLFFSGHIHGYER